MFRLCLLFVWSHVTAAASHSDDAQSVVLNNGVKMPKVSFAANVWDPDTCKSATASALDVGFRFIWSSALIGSSCQAAQGEAIAESGIDRSELFVAGTVNSAGCSSYDDCYSQTKSGAAEQFKLLGSGLDMLMLDYPSSGCDAISGQWAAFADLYSDKMVRSIAVSNFGATELGCIAQPIVQPVANQLRFCISCGPASPVVDANAKLGIVVQAYSPLGSGGLLSDPLLKTIGAAHNKSTAQVALRWIVQHNATIATQSTNPDHLKQDVAIFDFALSDTEMQQLDADGTRQHAKENFAGKAQQAQKLKVD